MDDRDRNQNEGLRDTSVGADRTKTDRDDDDNVAGNLIGEGVGGVSGMAAGMAIGSLGGPIGAVIGGLAGTLSGWWAEREISEAAHHYTDADDAAYRTHYESSPTRPADRSYEDVRPAYQLGHIASRNPDYANRQFEDVEGDLQRGWTNDVSNRHGEWQSVRGYARDAFARSRSGPDQRPAPAATREADPAEGRSRT